MGDITGVHQEKPRVGQKAVIRSVEDRLLSTTELGLGGTVAWTTKGKGRTETSYNRCGSERKERYRRRVSKSIVSKGNL